ncbi:MAG: VOC family protein [Oscillospiraceae bacterium]|nr:VOC family protein [Oscillospiraceae bacterium]
MDFRMLHHNHNVRDLDTSLAFYEKALGLHEKRRKVAADGSYIIVFIGAREDNFELELTWVRDHPQSYDLGEGEFHVAFGCEGEEYEAMHRLHQEMGCVCFENPAMGIYFIEDPDGFWLEIIPHK